MLVREACASARKLTSTGFSLWAAARLSTPQRPSPTALAWMATCGTLRNQGHRSRCAAYRRGAHHPRRRQGLEEHGHLNDELGRKTGYASNAHRPKFAFMNPELTFTLPPFQTAAGLTDMFCHLLGASSTTWARCL
ncbi:MAG: iron-containing alcohol dehydrogenase [Coriobacteriaceae bacterium]